MIKTDRKLKNTIVKFKPSMNDLMRYDETRRELQIVQYYNPREVVRSTQVDISPDLVDSSIQRLIEEGYLEKSLKHSNGYHFSITSRFVLRHEFWWDSFTNKFWNGFFLGVITTVIGGLLLLWLQGILGL